MRGLKDAPGTDCLSQLFGRYVKYSQVHWKKLNFDFLLVDQLFLKKCLEVEYFKVLAFNR